MGLVSFLRLIPLLLVLVPASRLSAADRVLTGRVRYRDGTPAKDARILFWNYAPIAGIHPPPETESDQEGRFNLHIGDGSVGAVSASKVSEGFPDAMIAYYGRKGSKSYQEIPSSKGGLSRTIQLRFGAPQQTVAWTVVDDRTGHQIQHARIAFHALSRRNVSGSQTVPDDGSPVLFVLPNSPLQVTVTAPGYVAAVFVAKNERKAWRGLPVAPVVSEAVRLKSER